MRGATDETQPTGAKMDDVNLMTAAVANCPADMVAQMALADAVAERTGDHEGAAKEAAGVAVRARVAEFVKHLDVVMVEHWADSGYTHSPSPVHEAEFMSEKWCRIVRRDRSFTGETRNGSVVAFVALEDSVTRTYGRVRAGDIHKPDGWKRAAKHARGSVLADDFGRCVGAHGSINYLR